MPHPNLIERRHTTARQLSETISTANSAGVRIIEVPRGAKCTFDQVQLSVVYDMSLDGDAEFQAWIHDQFFASRQLNDVEIRDLQPVWAAVNGFLFTAGGTNTANVVMRSPKEDVVIRPPKSNSDQWTIKNKGPGSDVTQGWTIEFGVITGAGVYAVTWNAVIDWTMEWLETSRSTRATWSMDQMTEEAQ